MINPLQSPPVERALLARSLGVRLADNLSLSGDEQGRADSESGLQPSYATPDPLCGPFGLCVPHVWPWVRGRG